MLVFLGLELTDPLEPELISFGIATIDGRELRARGLSRHHALADALALRAAYLAASGEAS